MSRGRKIALGISVFLAVCVIMGYYIRRDLSLPRLAVDMSNVPDVRVQDLDFRRNFSGKDWSIKTERAERKDEVITGYSMDVSVVAGNGQSSRFTALRGVYYETSADMVLYGVRGVATDGKSKLAWSADRSEYSSGSDSWSFPAGVVLERENLWIKAPQAVVEKSGSVSAAGGVSARWKEK